MEGGMGVRHQDLRSYNLSSILRVLRKNGPMARFQLAEETGLTRGAISTLCSELIARELLEETGTGERVRESRGGPRPLLLDIKADSRLAVGIQLSRKQVRAGLVNLKGHMIARREMDQPARPSPEEIAEMASRAVSEMVDALGVRSRLLGVGVGAPGVVDASEGIVRSDPYLGWSDVPLRELVEQRLRLPVEVDHNVRAMALAELRYGEGHERETFVEVYWSTGVGSGIAVRGELYTGGGHGDGQLGHVVIDSSGPSCICGNKGCLDTFVGEDALLRRARAELDQEVTRPEDLIQAARAGVPFAVHLLHEAGEKIGTALANVINVLGPMGIVIGGPFADADELVLEPIRETLAWRVHPHLRETVRLSASALGDDLGLIGAASLILEARFFAHPVLAL